MKNMKKLYRKIIFLLVCVFTSKSVLALEPIVNSNDGKYKDGSYQLNDLVQLLINISDWILAVSGAAALLAFIIGGVMFLISGGSPDRVTSGKNWLKGAIIGLVIVFTSYMIIDFVMNNIFGLKHEGFGNWATFPK